MEYPLPFQHLAEKVKPERANNARTSRREQWWRFGDYAKGLEQAIKGLGKVLVITLHTKYLTFAWSNVGTVFSHALAVIATDSPQHAGVLLSTIYQEWAAANGSSLGHTFRFTTSDCFETFPVPRILNHLGVIQLELERNRKEIMLSRELGLTAFYNEFHDNSNQEMSFQRIRGLQARLDQSLALAYGWDDIDLQHDFHLTDQGERYTICEAARREMLDRLLELNHQRYAEEVALRLHEKGRERGTGKRRSKQVVLVRNSCNLNF